VRADDARRRDRPRRTDPFFAGAIEASSRSGRGYEAVLPPPRADEALALAAIFEARQCDALVVLGDTHPAAAIDDLERVNARPGGGGGTAAAEGSL
jgi:hypothetical protein